MLWQVFAVQEWCFEYGARFLHQFVAVASAFEDARLDTARSVGDFTVGDLREQSSTMGCLHRFHAPRPLVPGVADVGADWPAIHSPSVKEDQ